MNKQIITTSILVLIILGLISAVVIGSKQNKSDQVTANIKGAVESVPSDTSNLDTLYWGTTCPHCHDTIEWIEENKIEEKIKIIRKEVYENQDNSQELLQKAKACGMNENSIGVPFMYTIDGECLVGTPDITNYLSSKIEAN